MGYPNLSPNRTFKDSNQIYKWFVISQSIFLFSYNKKSSTANLKKERKKEDQFKTLNFGLSGDQEKCPFL